MLAKTRGEEVSYSYGGEGIVTEDGKSKKNTFYEVKGVALYYTREKENSLTSNLSFKAHHDNICEQVVPFWKKKSSYGDVLSYVNYQRHCKVPTRHPC